MSDAMDAGREMDRLIAERVFAREVMRGGGYAHDISFADYPAMQVPAYSTELGEAEGLLALMREQGSCLTLSCAEDEPWWECSWIAGGERYTGRDATLALAICRAALEYAGAS